MAKVLELVLNAENATQAQFDNYSHSLIFASQISCQGSNTIIYTTGVEATSPARQLADDSQSEVSVDISTGKFVEGNLIAVWCPLSEAQSDLRDFMTFETAVSGVGLHIGVCNTTQSQDYTPAIIDNNRVFKMMSPAQISSLNL